MKVKIRRNDPSIELPAYQTKDSAAFDIATAEEKTIQPGEIVFIRTGLFIEAPHGYFLAIFSRSSTPKHKHVMFPHDVGIVDPDYSGPEDEILLQVYNYTDKPVTVKKGDRIAQGMFLPINRVEWTEVEKLRDSTRGGFGSTGN